MKSLKVQSYIIYEADFMDPLDQSSHRITLERRQQRTGEDKWGVFKNNSVLSKKDGVFIYEGFPSSRTEEDLENTRFNTVEEAVLFWEKVVEEYDRKLKILFYSLINKG